MKQNPILFLINLLLINQFVNAHRILDHYLVLNPIYSTLNQLTASSNFPKIENQSILLNPNNFYDVKFRTTYPIINQEF